MILNCAIIDDEPLAVNLLKTYVEKTPILHLVGAYTNTIEAMKDIKGKKIDLLYLDIQMPELSGLEFAKLMPLETKIVFTTAFKEFALDAFKLNTVDYLLKPFSYEEFLESCQRVLKWMAPHSDPDPIKRDRCIVVKSDYKMVRIDFQEILFIECIKDYVKFHLTDHRIVMTLMNMKKLEERLPNDIFKRTHRSFIANMQNFDSIERMRLIYGDAVVPISDSYKENVGAFLDQHSL